MSDLTAKAKAAWLGDHDEHEAPRLVWWGSTADAWQDGYETGYRAALLAIEDRELDRRMDWYPEDRDLRTGDESH